MFTVPHQLLPPSFRSFRVILSRVYAKYDLCRIRNNNRYPVFHSAYMPNTAQSVYAQESKGAHAPEKYHRQGEVLYVGHRPPTNGAPTHTHTQRKACTRNLVHGLMCATTYAGVKPTGGWNTNGVCENFGRKGEGGVYLHACEDARMRRGGGLPMLQHKVWL